MVKRLEEITLGSFSGGLNTEDSPHDMEDNDLLIANNVVFRPTGEVESIDGYTQIGPDITVNSLPATRILGGTIFSNRVYLLASNGTVARLVFLNTVTNSWDEVSNRDFGTNFVATFASYNDVLWIVNGNPNDGVSIYFVSTANVLTTLAPVSTGPPATVNRIVLHLDRMWLSEGNNIYVSQQFPEGNASDWLLEAYQGSDTPGLIVLEDSADDQVRNMISHFGKLVVFKRDRIFVVTGDVSLTGTITRSFDSRGTVSDFSIGQADKVLYFLSSEGVKRFDGATTLDLAGQYDSISSITLDRKIRQEIAALGDRRTIVGHAFKDAYYLSGNGNDMLVFDEFTGGWSKWEIGRAELFLEQNDTLHIASVNRYYSVNSNATTEIESTIKTKDFNLGSDNVRKIFERLLVVFKAVPGEHTFDIEWYANGSDSPTGTRQVTVVSDGTTWDATGATWDSGISWDDGITGFVTERLRKLGSGYTISFGIRATGANRFSLSSLQFIFEPTRREF